MNRVSSFFAASALALSTLVLCSAFQASAKPIRKAYYGFTAFPSDFTVEAVQRTQNIIKRHANLYALHFDDCVPWKELLKGNPFPGVEKKWDEEAFWIPAGHAVYLGLNPGAGERSVLAPSCGSDGEASGDMPPELRGASFDKPAVKKAFLEYARRAIRRFKPAFVNLGIEMGGVALHNVSEWNKFVTLYLETYTTLKREFPAIQFGFSTSAPVLLDPATAARIKPVVERSDYLGLSLYPYDGPFQKKIGAPSLPDGQRSWRKIMNTARALTSKPVAICETGFITKNVELEHYDLRLYGNESLQTAFVKDLVQYARRDNYPFVVWFLTVDYDALYEKMPKVPATEVNLLWRNAGLFRGDFTPKPALEAWKGFGMSR